MHYFTLLGLLYSCGSIKSKSKIELQTKKRELADIFSEGLELLGSPKVSRTKDNFTVTLIDRNLGERLKRLGFNLIDKKHLPLRLLDSEENRIQFLRGYFEGKSSVSAKSRVIKVSGKKEVLEQLKLLLDRENLDGRIYKNNTYFSLYIEGKMKCALFKEKIGFISKEKKNKLEKAISFSI